MTIFTEIALVAVTLIAMVGATVITTIAAWKPQDPGDRERWDAATQTVTRVQPVAPVVTWLQLFLAMEAVGVIVVVIISA